MPCRYPVSGFVFFSRDTRCTWRARRAGRFYGCGRCLNYRSSFLNGRGNHFRHANFKGSLRLGITRVDRGRRFSFGTAFKTGTPTTGRTTAQITHITVAIIYGLSSFRFARDPGCHNRGLANPHSGESIRRN